VKLRQILSNLLNNAIKFTATGGVMLHARGTVGDRVVFDVSDTGVGVSPQELSQLGAAFVQAEAGRRASEGTGLGLAISRGFAVLMGGELSLRSVLGEGTTATLMLPMTVLPGRVPATPAAPRRRFVRVAPNQAVPRVLAVDDREEGRRLVSRLLTPLGFEVREAGDGQQAVDEWRRWRPHLIWMDMRMPVMDGLHATRVIKAEAGADGAGDTPVIVALTASSLEEERAEVLAAGCDDLLRKPFKEASMLELLERHLGVRFEEEPGFEPPAAAATSASMPDASTVPAPLRERLSRALQRLDIAGVERSIADIGSHDRAVGDALLPMAGRFDYESIKGWLRGT
jgi:CheY-like chemotaxis protein